MKLTDLPGFTPEMDAELAWDKTLDDLYVSALEAIHRGNGEALVAAANELREMLVQRAPSLTAVEPPLPRRWSPSEHKHYLMGYEMGRKHGAAYGDGPPPTLETVPTKPAGKC